MFETKRSKHVITQLQVKSGHKWPSKSLLISENFLSEIFDIWDKRVKRYQNLTEGQIWPKLWLFACQSIFLNFCNYNVFTKCYCDACQIYFHIWGPGSHCNYSVCGVAVCVIAMRNIYLWTTRPDRDKCNLGPRNQMQPGKSEVIQLNVYSRHQSNHC